MIIDSSSAVLQALRSRSAGELLTLQRYDSDIAVYESGRKIFEKKLRGTFGNCSTALQRYSVTVLERLFSTLRKLLYLKYRVYF